MGTTLRRDNRSLKPAEAPARRAAFGFSLAVAVVAALIVPFAASARSIPDGRGFDTAVPFYGEVAVAKPVALQNVPQNPFMAAGNFSNIHNNSYMTDTYSQAGPLGKNTSVTSVYAKGECASVTFNSKGQIVAICLLPGKPAYLTLMQADTLKVITQLALPSVPATSKSGRANGISTRDYTELSGGYFFLDNKDRAVVSTATRHLITYSVEGSGSKQKFVVDTDVDLTGAVAEGDVIESALPDFAGNIWFVTLNGGKVGYVAHETNAISVTALPAGEEIANSFAMGKDGGIYVVSTAAMYRFDQATFPTVTWRTTYANSGVQKPGQKSIGSGTTPTIMPGGRVAIADNGSPYERIVVYDTKTGDKVCQAAISPRGKFATENSLISVGNALIVENNYGNATVQSTTLGRTTIPGMTRVDVSKDGTCTTTWRNTTESAPSVVPKFSAATGLIYTYTKPKGPGTIDRWYWTAIDFRTGKMVYSVLAGTGVLFNNSYASLYVGPSGDGYVGVIGGLIRVHDEG